MKNAASKSAARCCVCHRCLGDAISIKLGIGPKCAQKYGIQKPRKGRRYAQSMASVLGVPLFGEDL
jgi:hypothetical protein